MKLGPIVINFSDRETKRRFMATVGALHGLYEVRLKPRLKTRSLDANKYYFAAIVTPFAYYLSEQHGQDVDNDQAHEALKAKILGMDTIVDKETGEVIAEVSKRTRTMDSAEFSQYVDRCADFLAEFCEIEPIPRQYFGEEPEAERGKAA